MTNTILSDAEARVAPAVVKAKAQREAIIESMREEIGRSNFSQAKIELPKLKIVITQTVHPYLARLARLCQHAPTPLPASIIAHLRELEVACASGTDRVREGISEWEQLQPPFVKGTRELDVNRRAEEVGSIRLKLKNWDGVESRLRNLMASIDAYVEASGWPAAQPVGAGTIVSPREESREIVVERAL